MKRERETFHRFLVVNGRGEAWQYQPPFKLLRTAARHVRVLNRSSKPWDVSYQPFRVVHLIPAPSPEEK